MRETTSSPEVSRSSRCTIPERPAGPPATPRRSSACASVPDSCPRAGCTTTPAGLSTTSRCSSSQATEYSASGASAAGAATTSATSISSPPRSTWRFDRSSPSTRTRPSSISRCAAAREPACSARKTSSRSPAASGGTSTLGTARRPLEDVEQAQHPGGDADVGEVEGRPRREVEEVGHVAALHAVDQVARGAAQQQPGRAATRAGAGCGWRRRSAARRPTRRR